MQANDITLSQKAYSGIRQGLRSGRIKPGMRLVNRTLATELGLSLTPVREAINRLASEGIVEYVRGTGAFVRRFSHDDLAQIYDLREVIEPFAATEAAKSATKNQVAEIRRVCVDWVRQTRELRAQPKLAETPAFLERWNDNEVQFHSVLLRASHNRWLWQMVDSLRLMHDAFVAQRSKIGLLDVPAASQTCREHLQLFRALRTRNATAAHNLMRQHIAHGRKHVMTFLEQHEAHEANPSLPRNTSG